MASTPPIDVFIKPNKYFKRLIDYKFIDNMMFNIVTKETMDDLRYIVKSEMVNHKRVMSPRRRSGHLIRNVKSGYGRKSIGFYIGEVGVTANVPYARIQELGGIIIKKIQVSKSKSISLGGKKYITQKIILPARYYLRNPIFEYAVKSYAGQTFRFFNNLEGAL